MNMSLMKVTTSLLYFMSFLMTMSCKSYFSLWVFMEINILMFIMMTNKINMNMNNSLVKYFIIQSLSSMLLLFTFILMNNFNNTSELFKPTILLNMALWMKMGMFPFNAWFFQISENMQWKTWFLLNTFQKLIPLWILSMFISENLLINSMILMNAIYSSIEMFNQTSTRWLINCSSLNHFSWMMTSLLSNNMAWMNYFMIYTYLSLLLYKFYQKYNWKSLANYFNNFNNNSKIEICFILMNFMGLPPLLGFIPKLFIIYHSKTMILLIILMMNNMILIYMYMYMIMPIISLSLINKNMSLKTNKNINFYFMYFFLSLLVTTLY